MTRSPRFLLLAAVPVLMAGCASHGSTSAASRPAGGTSVTSGPAAPAIAPPKTATMVCEDEIKTKVEQVLDLPDEPGTQATWAAPVYTCTYALPMGPMTLTVDVLPDEAEGGAQLAAEQAATPGAQPLAGLGERAFGTPAGTAVVLKDNQILTVDTTQLPEVFGANDQKRTDLAYEVASDVLGCWTGDGDE